MGATIEGITFNGDDAYDRVTYRGVTLNKRTAAAVIQAQRLYGRAFNSIPQGSYHATTSQSAGTHDGGGAIDVFDSDLDAVQRVMRKVGFAAWHRTLLPGVWDPHCHAIMLGDKEMSSEARQQVTDYSNYIDGLAGHDTPDNTWHPFPKGDNPKPVFDYPQWVKEQDMQLDDDAYPADDKNNTTVGDLLHKLDRLDEFRTAVKTQFDGVDADLGKVRDVQVEQSQAIKAIRSGQDDIKQAIQDLAAAVKAGG
jgi:hypothetical protein